MQVYVFPSIHNFPFFFIRNTDWINNWGDQANEDYEERYYDRYMNPEKLNKHFQAYEHQYYCNTLLQVRKLVDSTA